MSQTGAEIDVDPGFTRRERPFMKNMVKERMPFAAERGREMEDLGFEQASALTRNKGRRRLPSP